MGLYSLALILLLGMCIHQFNAEPHFSPNLVVNGGAENGTEGWTVTTGGLARWNYADWSTDPNPPNGESYYFYGAQAAKSIATQKISIPHFSVSFNVSAYFGGWTGQADTATLNLSFLDSFGGMVGSNFTIGGLTAAERNSLSGFFFRSVSGAVPANARVILITLEFTRLEGTDNDGYIDAMSLITLIQPRDCFGVLDGSALIDACGVCGGNNQSCCLNYLGLENSLWDWLLMRDAIDDVIGKLEDLHFIFNCTSDNIPAPPSLCAPPEAAESFKTTLRALQLGDFIDTNNAWSSRCLDNFNQQVKKWTCVLNPAECCASSPL